MDALVIRRLRALAVPRRPAASASSSSGLAPAAQLELLGVLEQFGVRLRNPERLPEVDEAWPARWPALFEALAQLRGGHPERVEDVPLFLEFPTAVPDGDRYLAARMLGHVYRWLGRRVPTWLFDPTKFGADPITQMQTAERFEAGRADLEKRVADRHVEWLELELVFDDELTERWHAWLRQRLYAKSSIEQELRPDLATVLLTHGEGAALDPSRIVFLETKALVLAQLWQADRFAALLALARTPTDLLRMFAAVTETDVSLASKIRFVRMNRAERRVILTVLERSARLEEDLVRYRGLWLELGRYLHPREYAKSFPRTAAAFDRLRNAKIRTFEAETELRIAARELGPVLAHLQTRPGLFARRLHELLRRFPTDTAAVLVGFAAVIDAVPSKTLLILRRYVASIDAADHRVILTKLGKLQVLAKPAGHTLGPALVAELDALIHAALMRRFASKPSFAEQRIWIDPALADRIVPLQQRAASAGTLRCARGSRIPITFDKVLRIFVNWRQTAVRSDLDLSLLALDQDFNYVGHVSYTQLASEGIVHSGDVQSAPFGATELIDVTLAAVPERTRYLAAQVFRYAGESFDDLARCQAGWMLRSDVDPRAKLFDVRTVASKFDLSGKSGYAFPFFVDLVDREIVFTDLYMGRQTMHNRVEGATANIAAACKAIDGFTRTRPTLRELARLHVEARGGVEVERREDAEITFGLTGCTYDADNTGQVLAELL